MQLRSYHRAEFLSILCSQIPSHYRTHFGRRLVSYSCSSSSDADVDDDEITLQFKDGSTATCDVLVGADGVKSAVRRTMFSRLAAACEQENGTGRKEKFERCVDAQWSGITIYRALIERETLEAHVQGAGHCSLVSPVYVSPSLHPLTGML